LTNHRPDEHFLGYLCFRRGLRRRHFLVFNGLAQLPVVSLALGCAGAAAVVSFSALLAQTDIARPLRYCGRNSIVIYLAFFLPMAASRTILLKTGWIADIGTISAIVTVIGVIGSLALFWAVRRTFLRFLVERPLGFRLAGAPIQKFESARGNSDAHFGIKGTLARL